MTLGCAGGIVRPVSIRRWSVARIALIAVASMGILAGCVGVSPGATASVGSPNPTVADLAQIRAEIESQYAGQLLAIGEEATTVMVRFRSTAAASAAELLARYGSKVDIRVGLFPYPAPSGSANGSIARATSPGVANRPSGSLAIMWMKMLSSSAGRSGQ